MNVETAQRKQREASFCEQHDKQMHKIMTDHTRTPILGVEAKRYEHHNYLMGKR